MNIKDRFLRFTYNNINSEEFNLFYENNGEDIVFPFSPNSSHSISSPLFQNRTIWMGSTRDQKEVSLLIAGDKRTLSDTERILKWLDPSKPGKIRFDFRDNYEFDVIITSITTPTLIPIEMENGLIESIVRFKITFKTINDHLARSIDPIYLNNLSGDDFLYESDQLLPIVRKVSNNRYHFYNWTGVAQNVKINLKGSQPKVKRGVTEARMVESYSFISQTSLIANIDLEVGSIETNGRLFEVAHPTLLVVNEGPNPIQPGLVYEGYKNLSISGGNYKIPITDGMKHLDGGTYLLAVLPKIDRDTNTIYLDRKKGDPFTGLYPAVGSDIIRPAIFGGSIVGQEFVFTSANPDLTGMNEVKIVRADILGIENTTEHSIEFVYKKEV